jgi:hypothetical protein
LRDFGGHVSGNVCGLELTYDVAHDGDHTHLTGFVDDGAYESSIDVHDEKGITRRIVGRFSDQGTIDLELRKNHIYGAVGQRQFALARVGDKYVGWLRIRQSVVAKATVNGAKDLWTMPAATQAVVLPALLTCYGDAIEDRLGNNFQIGFGGHQSWEARHVSALYHNTTMDEQQMLNHNSPGGLGGPATGSMGGMGRGN